MLFLKNLIPFFLVFCLGLFTPALAEESVFMKEEKPKDSFPSIDEYEQVPQGMMLDPAQQATSPENAEDIKNGGGVKVTFEQAAKLYQTGKMVEAAEALQRLVESGHHAAEELLGVMYLSGQGVTKDPARAAALFTLAAEAARPLAQHHLGTMYFFGQGVEKNSVSALMWLHLAILYYPEGAEKTRAKQDRDNAYVQLTRRDKDRAKHLAREWLTKRGEAHLMDLQ